MILYAILCAFTCCKSMDNSLPPSPALPNSEVSSFFSLPPSNPPFLSGSTSHLLVKMKRVVSKVCRYRHHIVNIQTYLSCSRVPRGFHFSAQCPISLNLNREEQTTLSALQQSFGTTLTRLALACARRNFVQAVEDRPFVLFTTQSRVHNIH